MDEMTDSFIDAMDGTVTLEVNDNGDGQFIIVNVNADNGDAVGIALTPDQCDALAETLRIYAAGV